MVEYVERKREQESDDRQFGSWRGVISAWVIVLLFLALLGGVHAVAALRGSSHPDGHLAGAVIPRHDTTCGGPGIPSAPGMGRCQGTPLSEDRSAYW